MKHIKKLTILHSNDLHGDFLCEKVDKNLIGGVSLLSGYINKVRAEEQNVIYAIAGDMFRGSVIDSEFKGISTIQIMNAIAPDVVSIGNHEIDYGVAHLLFIEKCAKFPIINANMYIKTNGSRLFNPYKIIEIDGMKILFIGIVTEEVINSAKSEEVIGTIVDTADAAYEIGKICNAHNAIDIDFTVLLTHIGFEEDKKLAALLDPAWGVDVIIGGHSHTFMEEPTIINNIPIVQAGTGTDGIGRFDIDINTDTNSIDTYTWKFVPINDANCPKDEQIERMINDIKSVTDQKYEKVVTKFKHVLTHPARSQETEIGNLFADILKDDLGVDVMLLGSGSIRLEKLGPILTFGKLSECFPYAGEVWMIKVSGSMFRRMIKQILRDDAFLGHTEFYQFSKGISIKYNKTTKELLEFKLNGEDIKDDGVYSIALQDFHYKNMEDFLAITEKEVEQYAKPRIISTSDFDILNEDLSSKLLVDSKVEGRLVVVE